MSTIHKSLTNKRWDSLSFYEQMGNIGSEISRARNEQNREKAVERALDLIDLTLNSSKLKNKSELMRVREVLCDIVYGDNQYRVSLEELNQYFFLFAIAARMKR